MILLLERTATETGLPRREFIRRAASSSLGVAAAFALAGTARATDAAAACLSNPRLSAAQKSLRASLRFAEVAPDPARACGGCGFFSGGDCGHCQMLNSRVFRASSCDAWAKREAK